MHELRAPDAPALPDEPAEALVDEAKVEIEDTKSESSWYDPDLYGSESEPEKEEEQKPVVRKKDLPPDFTALKAFDEHVTSVVDLLSYSPEAFGAKSAHSKTGTILRIPHTAEGVSLVGQAGPMDERDRRMSEEFMSWVLSRRLSAFYEVEGQGILELQPKGPEVGLPMRLLLRAGTMIFFRHDQMNYRYIPDHDDCLVLQTWLMDKAEPLQFRQLPKCPGEQGCDRVHVKSMTERFPAGAENCDMSFAPLGCIVDEFDNGFNGHNDYDNMEHVNGEAAVVLEEERELSFGDWLQDPVILMSLTMVVCCFKCRCCKSLLAQKSMRCFEELTAVDSVVNALFWNFLIYQTAYYSSAGLVLLVLGLGFLKSLFLLTLLGANVVGPDERMTQPTVYTQGSILRCIMVCTAQVILFGCVIVKVWTRDLETHRIMDRSEVEWMGDPEQVEEVVRFRYFLLGAFISCATQHQTNSFITNEYYLFWLPIFSRKAPCRFGPCEKWFRFGLSWLANSVLAKTVITLMPLVLMDSSDPMEFAKDMTCTLFIAELDNILETSGITSHGGWHNDDDDKGSV
ncbi:ppsD [Symbiodinium natans]|uniref:PpsD protein n=1 Tax=Symbiodinium natans TaxID=878477 RepID=A0A812SPB4_9DINO|nr:ppsD [Symbiodinium natans]